MKKYNYRAGKNYRPNPLQDSTFYFFKGYLIRISNDRKSIWLYDRVSSISNFNGEKTLELAMGEVYKLIENNNKRIKEQEKERVNYLPH